MGRRGFTVLELLIVLAIIGILSAVLVPNIMRARERANDRAAQVHTKNVYIASVAHLSEGPNNVMVLGNCAVA